VLRGEVVGLGEVRVEVLLLTRKPAKADPPSRPSMKPGSIETLRKWGIPPGRGASVATRSSGIAASASDTTPSPG
jgi:hypothetical protein